MPSICLARIAFPVLSTVENCQNEDFATGFVDFVDQQIGRASNHPFVGATHRTETGHLREIAQPLRSGAYVGGDPSGCCQVALSEKFVNRVEMRKRIAGIAKSHSPHFFQKAAICSSLA